MKVLGCSANDSVRFRMFVAQALGVPDSRVQATVIGEHGDSQVLLFSSVRLDGKPVSLDPDAEKWVREQVAGIPQIMCRAIADDTGDMIPCSTPLEGEYGYHDLAMAVPVVLGHGGVREIQEWSLTPDEHVELERSVEALRPMMAYVDDYLKKNSPKTISRGIEK